MLLNLLRPRPGPIWHSKRCPTPSKAHASCRVEEGLGRAGVPGVCDRVHMQGDGELLRITQRIDGKGGSLLLPNKILKWGDRREDGTYPHMQVGRTEPLLEQLASQVAGSRQCSCPLALTYCSPEISIPKGHPVSHHPPTHRPCCLSAPWSQSVHCLLSTRLC